MYFRQILHEDASCASYLVGCPTYGVCAVVDPQGDPSVYRAQLERQGLRLTAVLETHVHADHVSCARELSRAADAPLYLGGGSGAIFPHHALADGAEVVVGNRRIRALHTPGHTAEHMCLLVDDWFVLTGDTLFVGDVGRVDLARAEEGPQASLEARAGQLYESLQKLLALPEWTEVYPGHYSGSVCGRGMDGKPVSTVGREKRKNKALQLDRARFIALQQENLPPVPKDFHRIKAGNLGHA